MKKIINIFLSFILIFTLTGCKEERVIIVPNVEVDPFSDEIFNKYFYANYETYDVQVGGIDETTESRYVIGINDHNYEYHSILSYLSDEEKEVKKTERHVFSILPGQVSPRIKSVIDHKSYIPGDSRIEHEEKYYYNMMIYNKKTLNGNTTRTKEIATELPQCVFEFHRASKIEAILKNNYPDVYNYHLGINEDATTGNIRIELQYLKCRIDSKEKFKASHIWYYLFNKAYDTLAFFHSENTTILDENQNPKTTIVYQEICLPNNQEFELPDFSEYN